MKFITIITPFLLGASLVSAAKKKPKIPKNGGGSSEETTEADQQAQETETSFAAQSTGTATGTLDVGEVISSFYPTQVPTVAPSVSTALASGLLSVESSWFNSPQYTSANAAIDSALPLTLKPSVAASGYYYADIITESWFINSVPATIQSAVKGYVTALESVHYKYLTATAAQTGRPTATAAVNSGAMITGAPMKVAGVVGIAGAIAVAVM